MYAVKHYLTQVFKKPGFFIHLGVGKIKLNQGPVCNKTK